jgi:FAD/FMN-containing dehydrogenase
MFVDKSEFFARIAEVIGENRVLVEPKDTDGYQQDWRGRYRGSAIAVLLPANTQEVSSLVRICYEMRVAIVPQGGNTGLTGGSIAGGNHESVIINLSRLNKIRDVDSRNNSMAVESGCVLQAVRELAQSHGLLFPMLLGSAGSCEIGGLVSTNAGGTGVLRYGNMRELVMGLEVVLPDGSIWDGMRALRKDNTGYDLKHLFVGAEGTLGIITAAVLKLFPQPTSCATGMVALKGVTEAVDLLRFLQARIGNRIEAFEIMSRRQIEIVMAYGHGLQSPMPLDQPWYVLIEIADSAQGWDPQSQLEDALSAALEKKLLFDAVVATDLAKAERIWELRHSISESNKRAGFTVSNDTSVPISQLSAFIERVARRIGAEVPACEVCYAGHIGDGNIHVIGILSRETYHTPHTCEAAATSINLIVHEESVALGGSISAEHGIGIMHVDRLEEFKAPIDLWMMRSIKSAFDPLGIMNPGKILRAVGVSP